MKNAQVLVGDARGSTLAITSNDLLSTLSVNDSAKNVLLHAEDNTITAGFVLTPDLAEKIAEALLAYALECRRTAS